ncbi:MAG: carbohydrate binding family 9 domain-containing protein, partial [Bacteroidales bacterium]|nr:carbohydrate binding family 9 domain-containing protein [Bacteroidales bacterium]
MNRFILSILTLLAVAGQLTAGQKGDIIAPVRVAVPPVIDGILDEEIWNSDPGISGFRTFMPDYGHEMPFRTVVWASYDEENLYYAFRCDDPEPSKIKVSVDARDKIRQDDWVCVNLDSFNDQQTLYCIYVNANGIQMDTRFAAGKEDLGMDLVFYSAASIDSGGYSVEIKLPLKSIRFTNREPVMMAATFERHISRISTQGTFPPLDPDQGMAFLTQMQPFSYSGVKHYKLLEILPSLTYTNRSSHTDGALTNIENRPDAGLTLKYGITSQLVLDATINPDFSQVEADAGQADANLRYQLFFPEKRPFFQEGNENFQIGAIGSSPLDPIVTMVHTRNIADPLAGVKISGKAGPNNNIALMYAADRVTEEMRETNGDYSHFPVLRFKRSLSNDGYLGAIATANINSAGSNYVYGADGNIRVNKSTLFEFHALGSETDKIAGHALGVNLHSEQRNVDWAFTSKSISDDFGTRTGFIDRTGVTIFTGTVAPKFYPESKLFRRIDLMLFSGQLKDNIYGMWETFNSITVVNLLGGTFRTNMRYNYSTEIYNNMKFNTSGIMFLLSGRIGTKFNGTMAYRFREGVYYSGSAQGYGSVVSGELRFLPTEKIHTQVNVTYQDLVSSADD